MGLHTFLDTTQIFANNLQYNILYYESAEY